MHREFLRRIKNLRLSPADEETLDTYATSINPPTPSAPKRSFTSPRVTKITNQPNAGAIVAILAKSFHSILDCAYTLKDAPAEIKAHQTTIFLDILSRLNKEKQQQEFQSLTAAQIKDLIQHANNAYENLEDEMEKETIKNLVHTAIFEYIKKIIANQASDVLATVLNALPVLDSDITEGIELYKGQDGLTLCDVLDKHYNPRSKSQVLTYNQIGQRLHFGMKDAKILINKFEQQFQQMFFATRDIYEQDIFILNDENPLIEEFILSKFFPERASTPDAIAKKVVEDFFKILKPFHEAFKKQSKDTSGALTGIQILKDYLEKNAPQLLSSVLLPSPYTYKQDGTLGVIYFTETITVSTLLTIGASCGNYLINPGWTFSTVTDKTKDSIKSSIAARIPQNTHSLNPQIFTARSLNQLPARIVHELKTKANTEFNQQYGIADEQIITLKKIIDIGKIYTFVNKKPDPLSLIRTALEKIKSNQYSEALGLEGLTEAVHETYESINIIITQITGPNIPAEIQGIIRKFKLYQESQRSRIERHQALHALIESKNTEKIKNELPQLIIDEFQTVRSSLGTDESQDFSPYATKVTEHFCGLIEAVNQGQPLIDLSDIENSENLIQSLLTDILQQKRFTPEMLHESIVKIKHFTKDDKHIEVSISKPGQEPFICKFFNQPAEECKHSLEKPAQSDEFYFSVGGARGINFPFKDFEKVYGREKTRFLMSYVTAVGQQGTIKYYVRPNGVASVKKTGYTESRRGHTFKPEYFSNRLLRPLISRNDDTSNEVALLKILNQERPNKINYFEKYDPRLGEIYLDKQATRYSLSMDLAPGVSLADETLKEIQVLDKRSPRYLNPTVNWNMADSNYRHRFFEDLKVAQALTREIGLLHQKGFSHNDIKPENFFYLRKPDGSYNITLIDFATGGVKGNYPLTEEEKKLHPQQLFEKIFHYRPNRRNNGSYYDDLGRQLRITEDGQCEITINPKLDIFGPKKQGTLAYLPPQILDSCDPSSSVILASPNTPLFDDWAATVLAFGICKKDAYFKFVKGRAVNDYVIPGIIEADGNQLKIANSTLFNQHFLTMAGKDVMYVPANKREGEPLHLFKKLIALQEQLKLKPTDSAYQALNQKINDICSKVLEAVDIGQGLSNTELQNTLQTISEVFLKFEQLESHQFEENYDLQVERILNDFTSTQTPQFWLHEQSPPENLSRLAFILKHTSPNTLERVKTFLTNKINKKSVYSYITDTDFNLLVANHQEDLCLFIIKQLSSNFIPPEGLCHFAIQERLPMLANQLIGIYHQDSLVVPTTNPNVSREENAFVLAIRNNEHDLAQAIFTKCNPTSSSEMNKGLLFAAQLGQLKLFQDLMPNPVYEDLSKDENNYTALHHFCGMAEANSYLLPRLNIPFINSKPYPLFIAFANHNFELVQAILANLTVEQILAQEVNGQNIFSALLEKGQTKIVLDSLSLVPEILTEARVSPLLGYLNNAGFRLEDKFSFLETLLNSIFAEETRFNVMLKIKDWLGEQTTTNEKDVLILMEKLDIIPAVIFAKNLSNAPEFAQKIINAYLEKPNLQALVKPDFEMILAAIAEDKLADKNIDELNLIYARIAKKIPTELGVIKAAKELSQIFDHSKALQERIDLLLKEQTQLSIRLNEKSTSDGEKQQLQAALLEKTKELENLAKTNQALKEQLSRLETDNASLKKETGELNSLLKDQSNLITKQQEKLSLQEGKIKLQEAQFEQKKSKLDKIIATLEDTNTKTTAAAGTLRTQNTQIITLLKHFKAMYEEDTIPEVLIKATQFDTYLRNQLEGQPLEAFTDINHIFKYLLVTLQKAIKSEDQTREELLAAKKTFEELSKTNQSLLQEIEKKTGASALEIQNLKLAHAETQAALDKAYKETIRAFINKLPASLQISVNEHDEIEDLLNKLAEQVGTQMSSFENQISLLQEKSQLVSIQNTQQQEELLTLTNQYSLLVRENDALKATLGIVKQFIGKDTNIDTFFTQNQTKIAELQATIASQTAVITQQQQDSQALRQKLIAYFPSKTTGLEELDNISLLERLKQRKDETHQTAIKDIEEQLATQVETNLAQLTQIKDQELRLEALSKIEGVNQTQADEIKQLKQAQLDAIYKTCREQLEHFAKKPETSIRLKLNKIPTAGDVLSLQDLRAPFIYQYLNPPKAPITENDISIIKTLLADSQSIRAQADAERQKELEAAEAKVAKMQEHYLKLQSIANSLSILIPIALPKNLPVEIDTLIQRISEKVETTLKYNKEIREKSVLDKSSINQLELQRLETDRIIEALKKDNKIFSDKLEHLSEEHQLLTELKANGDSKVALVESMLDAMINPTTAQSIIEKYQQNTEHRALLEKFTSIIQNQAEYKSLVEKYKEANNSLIDGTQNITSQIQELLEKNSITLTEPFSIETAIQALDKAYLAKLSEADELLKTQQEKLNELESSSTNSIALLQSDNQKLKKEKEALQSNLKQINELEAEIKRLGTSHQSALSSLNQTLEDSKAQIQELEHSQQQQIHESCLYLISQIQIIDNNWVFTPKLNYKITDLSEFQATLDGKLKKLKENFDSLVKKNEVLGIRLKTGEENNQILIDEKNQLEQTLQELKLKLESTASQRALDARELEQSQKEKKDILSQITTLLNEIGEAPTELTDSAQEHATLTTDKAILEHLKTAIRNLNADKAAIKETVEKTEEKLELREAAIQENIKMNLSRLEQLGSDDEDIKDFIQQFPKNPAQGVIQQLNELLNQSIATHLKTLKEKIQALNKSSEDYETKLLANKELSEEIKTLSTENTSLNQEIDRLIRNAEAQRKDFQSRFYNEEADKLIGILTRINPRYSAPESIDPKDKLEVLQKQIEAKFRTVLLTIELLQKKNLMLEENQIKLEELNAELKELDAFKTTGFDKELSSLKASHEQLTENYKALEQSLDAIFSALHKNPLNLKKTTAQSSTKTSDKSSEYRAFLEKKPLSPSQERLSTGPWVLDKNPLRNSNLQWLVRAKTIPRKTSTNKERITPTEEISPKEGNILVDLHEIYGPKEQEDFKFYQLSLKKMSIKDKVKTIEAAIQKIQEDKSQLTTQQNEKITEFKDLLKKAEQDHAFEYFILQREELKHIKAQFALFGIKFEEPTEEINLDDILQAEFARQSFNAIINALERINIEEMQSIEEHKQAIQAYIQKCQEALMSQGKAFIKALTENEQKLSNNIAILENEIKLEKEQSASVQADNAKYLKKIKELELQIKQIEDEHAKLGAMIRQTLNTSDSTQSAMSLRDLITTLNVSHTEHQDKLSNLKESIAEEQEKILTQNIAIIQKFEPKFNQASLTGTTLSEQISASQAKIMACIQQSQDDFKQKIANYDKDSKEQAEEITRLTALLSSQDTLAKDMSAAIKETIANLLADIQVPNTSESSSLAALDKDKDQLESDIKLVSVLSDAIRQLKEKHQEDIKTLEHNTQVKIDELNLVKNDINDRLQQSFQLNLDALKQFAKKGQESSDYPIDTLPKDNLDSRAAYIFQFLATPPEATPENIQQVSKLLNDSIRLQAKALSEKLALLDSSCLNIDSLRSKNDAIQKEISRLQNVNEMLSLDFNNQIAQLEQQQAEKFKAFYTAECGRLLSLIQKIEPSYRLEPESFNQETLNTLHDKFLTQQKQSYTDLLEILGQEPNSEELSNLQQQILSATKELVEKISTITDQNKQLSAEQETQVTQLLRLEEAMSETNIENEVLNKAIVEAAKDIDALKKSLTSTKIRLDQILSKLESSEEELVSSEVQPTVPISELNEAIKTTLETISEKVIELRTSKNELTFAQKQTIENLGKKDSLLSQYLDDYFKQQINTLTQIKEQLQLTGTKPSEESSSKITIEQLRTVLAEDFDATKLNQVLNTLNDKGIIGLELIEQYKTQIDAYIDKARGFLNKQLQDFQARIIELTEKETALTKKVDELETALSQAQSNSEKKIQHITKLESTLEELKSAHDLLSNEVSTILGPDALKVGATAAKLTEAATSFTSMFSNMTGTSTVGTGLLLGGSLGGLVSQMLQSHQNNTQSIAALTKEHTEQQQTILNHIVSDIQKLGKTYTTNKDKDLNAQIIEAQATFTKLLDEHLIAFEKKTAEYKLAKVKGDTDLESMQKELKQFQDTNSSLEITTKELQEKIGSLEADLKLSQDSKEVLISSLVKSLGCDETQIIEKLTSQINELGLLRETLKTFHELINKELPELNSANAAEIQDTKAGLEKLIATLYDLKESNTISETALNEAQTKLADINKAYSELYRTLSNDFAELPIVEGVVNPRLDDIPVEFNAAWIKDAFSKQQQYFGAIQEHLNQQITDLKTAQEKLAKENTNSLEIISKQQAENDEIRLKIDELCSINERLQKNNTENGTKFEKNLLEISEAYWLQAEELKAKYQKLERQTYIDVLAILYPNTNDEGYKDQNTDTLKALTKKFAENLLEKVDNLQSFEDQNQSLQKDLASLQEQLNALKDVNALNLELQTKLIIAETELKRLAAKHSAELIAIQQALLGESTSIETIDVATLLTKITELKQQGSQDQEALQQINVKLNDYINQYFQSQVDALKRIQAQLMLAEQPSTEVDKLLSELSTITEPEDKLKERKDIDDKILSLNENLTSCRFDFASQIRTLETKITQSQKAQTEISETLDELTKQKTLDISKLETFKEENNTLQMQIEDLIATLDRTSKESNIHLKELEDKLNSTQTENQKLTAQIRDNAQIHINEKCLIYIGILQDLSPYEKDQVPTQFKEDDLTELEQALSRGIDGLLNKIEESNELSSASKVSLDEALTTNKILRAKLTDINKALAAARTSHDEDIIGKTNIIEGLKNQLSSKEFEYKNQVALNREQQDIIESQNKDLESISNNLDQLFRQLKLPYERTQKQLIPKSDFNFEDTYSGPNTRPTISLQHPEELLVKNISAIQQAIAAIEKDKTNNYAAYSVASDSLNEIKKQFEQFIAASYLQYLQGFNVIKTQLEQLGCKQESKASAGNLEALITQIKKLNLKTPSPSRELLNQYYGLCQQIIASIDPAQIDMDRKNDIDLFNRINQTLNTYIYESQSHLNQLISQELKAIKEENIDIKEQALGVLEGHTKVSELNVELFEKCNKLNARITTLTAGNEKLEKELVSIIDSNETIKQQLLTAAQAEYENLCRIYESLSGHPTPIRENPSVEDYQNAISELKCQIDTNVRYLTDSNNQKGQEVWQLQLKINELKKENNLLGGLPREKQELTHELEELRKQHSSLMTQVQDLPSIIFEDASTSSVSDIFNPLKERVSKLKAELSSQQYEILSLKLSINEEQEARLANNLGLIEKLQSHLPNPIRPELSFYNLSQPEKIKASEEMLMDLVTKQNERIQQTVRVLEVQILENEGNAEEIKHLKAKITTLKTENDTIRGEISLVTLTNVNLQLKLESLNSKCLNQEAAIKSLKDQEQEIITLLSEKQVVLSPNTPLEAGIESYLNQKESELVEKYLSDKKAHEDDIRSQLSGIINRNQQDLSFGSTTPSPDESRISDDLEDNIPNLILRIKTQMAQFAVIDGLIAEFKEKIERNNRKFTHLKITPIPIEILPDASAEKLQALFKIYFQQITQLNRHLQTKDKAHSQKLDELRLGNLALMKKLNETTEANDTLKAKLSHFIEALATPKDLKIEELCAILQSAKLIDQKQVEKFLAPFQALQRENTHLKASLNTLLNKYLDPIKEKLEQILADKKIKTPLFITNFPNENPLYLLELTIILESILGKHQSLEFKPDWHPTAPQIALDLTKIKTAIDSVPAAQYTLEPTEGKSLIHQKLNTLFSISFHLFMAKQKIASNDKASLKIYAELENLLKKKIETLNQSIPLYKQEIINKNLNERTKIYQETQELEVEIRTLAGREEISLDPFAIPIPKISRNIRKQLGKTQDITLIDAKKKAIEEATTTYKTTLSDIKQDLYHKYIEIQAKILDKHLARLEQAKITKPKELQIFLEELTQLVGNPSSASEEAKDSIAKEMPIVIQHINDMIDEKAQDLMKKNAALLKEIDSLSDKFSFESANFEITERGLNLQIDELNAKDSVSSEAIKALQQDLKNEKETIKTLQEAIKTQEAKIINLEKANTSISNQKTTLSDQIDLYHQKLAAQRDRLAEYETTLKKQESDISELSKRSKALEAENLGLKSRIEEAKAEIARLNDANKQLQAGSEKLSEANQSIDEQNKSLQSDLSRLQFSLLANKLGETIQQARIPVLQTQLDKQAAILAKYKADINSQKQSLDELEKANKTLQASIRSLESSKSALEGQLGGSGEEIKKLKEQEFLFNVKIEAQQRLLQKYVGKFDNQTRTHQKLKVKFEELTKQYQSSEAKNKQLSEKLAAAETEINLLNKGNSELQQQLDGLSQAFSQADKANQSLSIQIQQLKLKLTIADRSSLINENLIAELNKKLSAQEVLLKSHRDSIDQQQQQLQELRSENERLISDFNQLEGDFNASEDELSKLHYNQKDLQAALAEKANQLASLQSDYKRLQSETAALKKQVNPLKIPRAMAPNPPMTSSANLFSQQPQTSSASIQGDDKGLISKPSTVTVFAHVKSPEITATTPEKEFAQMIQQINPPSVPISPGDTPTTLYSASGQSYQFSFKDVAKAELPRVQSNNSNFDKQKLCLTVMNMLENIMVHHDIISLNTKNPDIIQYAKDYIHCLNTHAVKDNPFQLKINDKLVTFDASHTYSDTYKSIWNEGPSSRVGQSQASGGTLQLYAVDSPWFNESCKRRRISPDPSPASKHEV